MKLNVSNEGLPIMITESANSCGKSTNAAQTCEHDVVRFFLFALFIDS